MGLWTKLHAVTLLPTLAILCLIACLIGYAMRNAEQKWKRLPLQIVTIVLLVLEVVKQALKLFPGPYDTYALPFHFCSIFLFVLPFHAFYQGKHRRFVESATFGCCSALLMFMLLMPTVVYSDGNIQAYFSDFSSFHTVTFHALVCFYFMLMLALHQYQQDTKKDIKNIVVFLFCYEVVATAMSYLLDTNFHNLLHCNLGIGEEIRLSLVGSLGTFGQILYTLAIFVGTFLFVSLSYILVVYFSRLVTCSKGKILSKLSKRQEK